MAIMRPGPEDEPRLDLGKKVSTTQDLMIEELSLPHNRGSRLFQQRQRRMQRFTFENLSSHREVGLRLSPSSNRDSPFPAGKRFLVRSGVSQPCSYIELPGPGGSHRTERGDREGAANEWTAGEDAGGQQSYHSELHVAASPQGGPPEVPKKTEKVLQMSKILNPDALAPGYSGPLKEVPPEKFNVTAIPKGYRSPWHDLLGDKDNAVFGEYQPPMRPSQWDFRSFNRTPAPFDRTQLSDLFFVPATELDNLSALEVIDHRRNFNRVPQGWVRILPESDEL